MHATGFEPAMLAKRTDYESGAFDHSAMHATKRISLFTMKSNLVFLSFQVGGVQPARLGISRSIS